MPDDLFSAKFVIIYCFYEEKRRSQGGTQAEEPDQGEYFRVPEHLHTPLWPAQTELIWETI
jgi:hypothetical protein